MKRLILFAFLSILTFSITAQTKMLQLRTTSGKLLPYGKVATATTNNATPLLIDSLAIVDNTTGIIELTVLGVADTGDAVFGKQVIKYKKVAGTLTLATAHDEYAKTTDSGISGATYSFTTTASGNAKLEITGKAATVLRWRTRIEPFYL